jgi:hypothetical protein
VGDNAQPTWYEARPTWYEARLADDFLGQALDAFVATGDATRLGITTRKMPEGGTDRERAVALFARRQAAIGKRLEFARTAVLFTALAVEAAANFYIATMLPEDAERLDKLKTVDKLLVAPRLASGEALFVTDREPIGQVRRLFQLRNRIVHPKVGKSAVVGDVGGVDFTPLEAAKCMVAAARVVYTLHETLPDSQRWMGIGSTIILDYEPWLMKTSRKFSDELPKPPTTLARKLREASAERVTAQE